MRILRTPKPPTNGDYIGSDYKMVNGRHPNCRHGCDNGYTYEASESYEGQMQRVPCISCLELLVVDRFNAAGDGLKDHMRTAVEEMIDIGDYKQGGRPKTDHLSFPSVLLYLLRDQLLGLLETEQKPAVKGLREECYPPVFISREYYRSTGRLSCTNITQEGGLDALIMGLVTPSQERTIERLRLAVRRYQFEGEAMVIAKEEISIHYDRSNGDLIPSYIWYTLSCHREGGGVGDWSSFYHGCSISKRGKVTVRNYRTGQWDKGTTAVNTFVNRAL